MTLTPRELNEQKHFDTFADRYDYNYHYTKPFTKYKIDKKSREFVRLVRSNYLRNRIKVLEIGCGTGEYTKHLAKRMPEAQIIGLDISRNVIKIAKTKCKKFKNTSFIIRSAYKTGFKENSLDVVCGFYVLHHLEIPRVRKEILRILKPDGLVFFYEPNVLNPIVYLIKSSKILKKIVGDSPDEWAINPLSVKKVFSPFEVLNIAQTEFIWPVDSLPLNLLKFMDRATSFLRFVPLIKYLGGSVQICLRKR